MLTKCLCKPDIIDEFMDKLAERDVHYREANTKRAEAFVDACLSIIESALRVNPQHSRVFSLPWNLFDPADYWSAEDDTVYPSDLPMEEKLQLMQHVWLWGNRGKSYRVVFKPLNTDRFVLKLKSITDMF